MALNSNEAHAPSVPVWRWISSMFLSPPNLESKGDTIREGFFFCFFNLSHSLGLKFVSLSFTEKKKMEYNTTATSKTALASNLVLRKISPLMLADSDSKK